MSHSSSTKHYQPSPSFSPDLAERIKKLQEAVNSLLDGLEQEEKTLVNPETDGETRTYYFPASVVRRESELLRQHRVDDFSSLLERAHTLLAGVAKVMRSTSAEARLKGYAFVSMGVLLEQVSALLLRMRNLYSTVERIKP